MVPNAFRARLRAYGQNAILSVPFLAFLSGPLDAHEGQGVNGGPLADAGFSHVEFIGGPVCGMTVETATAKTSVRAGHTHYFCSTGCRD